jgi:hypothetical protein
VADAFVKGFTGSVVLLFFRFFRSFLVSHSHPLGLQLGLLVSRCMAGLPASGRMVCFFAPTRLLEPKYFFQPIELLPCCVSDDVFVAHHTHCGVSAHSGIWTSLMPYMRVEKNNDSPARCRLYILKVMAVVHAGKACPEASTSEMALIIRR